MRSPRFVIIAVILGLIGLILVLRLSRRPTTDPPGTQLAPSTPAPGTNETAITEIADGTNAVDGASTNLPPTSPSHPTNGPPREATGDTNTPPAPTAVVSPPQPESTTTVETASTDLIQLSFKGARVDMVVDWLAKTTGKSVVKHPRVNCQLTIVSSNKLPVREALNLVYRALLLEECSVIESRDAILIVPKGQEPKLAPELLTDGRDEIPEGHQLLLKVFPLQHVQAHELKDRVQVVLSDNASVDVDSRSNQLIVTDSTDNIRLLTELIRELDVPSPGDTVVELYPLKHAEASQLADLLGLILNSKAAPASTSSSSRPSSSRPSSSRSTSSSSRRSSMPPGVSLPPGASGPTPSGPSAPTITSSSGPSDAIRFWADSTANRLIVAAPRSRLPEIEELIGILDQEKPQDVTLRVIALQNVDAQDLVREIAPLYQKMSGSSLKDTIEVAANSRANSIIVLSSESNFKAIERLVVALDTEEAQEKVMRAFPLDNADAEDVARQLEDLNVDQQDSFSRFVYVYPPRPRGGDAKMSVVADRRRNTVIVQAPPGAMENIAEMIAILDEPVSDDSLAPRIFPLRYVSAVDIEDVLNELFLRRRQQRSYWDPYYDSYSSSSTDQDAGRLYGKVRITSEPYSNSIIVTSNSPENLSAVEAVLKQLDVPSQAGETTVRLELRFAQAIEVAKSVNILFAKGGSPPLRAATQQRPPQQPSYPQQQALNQESGFELEQEQVEEAYYPWLGGQQDSYRSLDGRSSMRPISDLVGRVRIVPDRRSNSLMITSNVHLLPQVLKLIQELDVPTSQVLLEARIVAVASDFREKLGMRWSPDGSQVFTTEDLDNSLLANVNAEYTETLLGNALPDSLRRGIFNSSISVDFLLQFLKKNVDLRVLAEPQINVADNEIGRLFVGSKIPFLSGSLNTDVGGRNDTFEYRDVGIILEITPYINNDSDVTLRIRIESSSIREGETLFGGAIIDTRDFRTEVTLHDRQTLVLGGILQTEESKTVRKVPILGDIPLLGYLFKKKDTVARELVLLVFLQPQVTRTPEEAQQLLREVEQRTPLIQRWTDELAPPALDLEAPSGEE
jgi:type II secretion system protein D